MTRAPNQWRDKDYWIVDLPDHNYYQPAGNHRTAQYYASKFIKEHLGCSCRIKATMSDHLHMTYIIYTKKHGRIGSIKHVSLVEENAS